MAHAHWRILPTLALAAAGLAGCEPAPSPTDAGPTPDILVARAIPAGPYMPGQSYFGRNQYIEYIAGNAPVILSAPHGGILEPSEIPNRTAGACGGSATTTRDLNTIELTLAVRDEYHARFGTWPHVIINHLRRTRLDANRDIVEGACGDPEAEEAWNEFQDFIDVAKSEVLQATGKGWYMDMHGHGHEIQRLELGYLVRGSVLDGSDSSLDGNPAYQDTSSVKTLSEDDASTSFSQLLRGPASLGTLYADNGFRSIPSSYDPGPQGNSYFTGGYNTQRHTCGLRAAEHGGDPGGQICGVQVEANYSGVRDAAANRQEFGRVTALVLESYLGDRWGLQLGGGNATPVADFTWSCADLDCSFTDASTDADGTVVSWSWDFGDGGSSTLQNPDHTFAAPGDYSVSLTVTDDQGGEGGTSRTVSVAVTAPIALSASRYKVKGVHHVDLAWSGAGSAQVDVYRDGGVVATTANDGAHTDVTGQKGSGTYIYRVCEAGTAVCSDPVTVDF